MKKINTLRKLSAKYCFGLLVMLMFSVSCNENVLDEDPSDFLSPSAFKTKKDIEMGITALHSMVRDWYAISRGGTDMVIMARMTDEGYCGESPSSGGNYQTDMTPSSDYPKSYWSRNYTLIQYTNVIIEAINNMEESAWSSNDEKNAELAEAKFFRAFAYRVLVTLFGDVPLVTEVVDYAKTNFTRNAKSEIYSLIEADLTTGTAYLPNPGSETAPGRITKGAAWNLLSEIYLAEGKYQLAVDAASHVINDYGYSLMTQRFGTKLGADVFKNENVYFDLFTKENHNHSANTEDIWVIQIEYNITGGGSFPGERAWGPAYFRLGNTPDGYDTYYGEYIDGDYTGYQDTLSRPVAWCRPTSYVLYNIWKNDKGDYRNSEACIKRNFYIDSPYSTYDGKKIDWKWWTATSRPTMTDTTQYIFPFFMKVATPCDHQTEPLRSGGGTNYKDLYAMRLAETYLLRAEGYLGLGKTDLAAADINKVRSRSNASPVAAGDVTIDYILDERARELYTEEWRMITLMRLGKLVERVKKYNDNPVYPGENIQSYNNLWPIPQTEIDLNTGATLEQNPGYE